MGKSKKLKILILGDSLALPRDEISYESTWISMLTDLGRWNIINRSKRAADTKFLVNSDNSAKDNLEYYHPDIVIIQIGIVDCAPRLYGRLGRAVVYRLPESVSYKITRTKEALFKRSSSKSVVSASDFKKNINAYLERCVRAKVNSVIFVRIGSASQNAIRRNSNLPAAIDRYNSIIDSFSSKYPILKIIDPFDPKKVDDFVLPDGYHLNERGHSELVRRLLEILPVNT